MVRAVWPLLVWTGTSWQLIRAQRDLRKKFGFVSNFPGKIYWIYGKIWYARNSIKCKKEYFFSLGHPVGFFPHIASAVLLHTFPSWTFLFVVTWSFCALACWRLLHRTLPDRLWRWPSGTRTSDPKMISWAGSLFQLSLPWYWAYWPSKTCF